MRHLFIMIMLLGFTSFAFSEDIIEEDLSYTFYEEEVDVQKSKKRDLASDIEQVPEQEMGRDPANGREAADERSSAIKFWKY